jgi:TonB family protein
MGVLFNLSGPASPDSPSATPPIPCPLEIRYAGLLAIGSVHQSAEYVVELKADPPSSNSRYSVGLEVGTVAGNTISQTLDEVTTEQVHDWADNSALIIFVLPADRARWFRIDRVSSPGTSVDCSMKSAYWLNEPKHEATGYFDDGVAWINIGKPTLVQVDAPLNATQPTYAYPQAALDSNTEGDVDVVTTIGADGTASDTTLQHSSAGFYLDNAAFAAVRYGTFKPAHLPTALGGANLSVKWELKFTYRIVKVGITIGPTGAVEKTWIASPSRDTHANDAALKAAASSHFKPPLSNGSPTTKDYQTIYNFVGVQ